MKHLNNEKGFTLVELLIALAILAVGLLGLAGMQVNAIASNKFANRLSCMTATAQGVLDDLMARSTDDILFDSSSSNNTYDLDKATPATTITLPGAGTLSATYSVTIDTPAVNVVRIVVTITAGTKSLSLTSYKRAT